jgi:hypothetical protein
MFNTLDVTSIKIEEICHANKHYLTFMDAVTGAPLSGLKVTKENLSGMRFYRKTDRNGMLRIHRSEESWRWDHFVNDGPDCVVDYMVYDPMDIIDEDDEKPSIYRGRYYAHYGETIPSAIVLDRPVYRPGQTVYFKVYKVQGHKMDVNSPIIVELRDKADKVVESIELRTNKFGTVSGGFTLPETMTYGGKLCIREKGNVTNWQRFSISAYKLPTFKVELRHVVEPLTIGDSVHFVGRAVSFTGDPIRFANVTVSVYNNRYNSKTRTLYALQTDEKGDFHFQFAETKCLLDDFNTFEVSVLLVVCIFFQQLVQLPLETLEKDLLGRGVENHLVVQVLASDNSGLATVILRFDELFDGIDGFSTFIVGHRLIVVEQKVVVIYLKVT